MNTSTGGQDILLTSPRGLATEQDTNEDRVLLTGTSEAGAQSRRLLFTSQKRIEQLNMDQIDVQMNVFSPQNVMCSPYNNSTPSTNQHQSNRALFTSAKYTKDKTDEVSSLAKTTDSQKEPIGKLSTGDEPRSSRWGIYGSNDRKVQFGEKPQDSLESRASEPRSQLSSHNMHQNNSNAGGGSAGAQAPRHVTVNVIQSANQIINIKNAKMLNRKLNDNHTWNSSYFQPSQQYIPNSSQMGGFTGRRPGSETGGPITGWNNLKKRIEALKYLMRNIEMSGMIQIVSKLRTQHISIIQDLGSDFIRNNNNSGSDSRSQAHLSHTQEIEIKCLEKFIKYFRLLFLQLFASVPTVNNQMMIVVSFKIILAMQLLYQIFLLPLMVSFPENSVNLFSDKHPILRVWFVLPFVFEIMLNFNLSYYENGERITAKLLIISRYLRKEFLWDLLGVFGSAALFEEIGLYGIFIIFVIRFIKFKLMYESIEEKFQLSLRFAVPYTLLNLFLSITLVAHICGCIFQWIAYDLSEQGVRTWLNANNLFNSSISDRYIASLYFSYITMISVGYGDIVPISNEERIFVIFMTIFSCGVFAYVVSSISELFEQIYNKDSDSKQQKYEISNYMETRKIDSDLQTKVFQYLQMLRTKKQQEPESGQGILDIMNPKLRDSIYQNYYGRHLKGWRLFSSIFSEQFLDVLSIQCQEQVFGPGEIIYYQNQNSSARFTAVSENGLQKSSEESQYIYLIIKGTVLVYEDNPTSKKHNSKSNNAYFTKYTAGESIGTKEFFCGILYEFTAQSEDLTTLIKIQRSQFLDVLSRFPKDYESFAQMRDEITFSHPDKYTKCEPCNRYDHSLYKCPRMHFSKRQLKTIYAHLYSEPQDRRKQEMERRKHRFHATGSENIIIRQQLKLYRVHLVNSIMQSIYQQNNNSYDGDDYFKSEEHMKGLKSSAALGGGICSFEVFPDGNSYNQRGNSNMIIPAPGRSPRMGGMGGAGGYGAQAEPSNFASMSKLAKQQLSQQHQIQKGNYYDDSDEIEVSVDSIMENSEAQSRSRTMLLDSQAQEILEYANEDQDEMFFFKCPMLIWIESEHKYAVSLDEDEDEGNAAIKQYLESNFDIFINEEGDFAYPIEDSSQELSAIESRSENMENDSIRERRPEKQLQLMGGGGAGAGIGTQCVTEEVIEEEETDSRRGEDCTNDDIVRISAGSLSYQNLSSNQKKKQIATRKGTIDMDLGESRISDYSDLHQQHQLQLNQQQQQQQLQLQLQQPSSQPPSRNPQSPLQTLRSQSLKNENRITTMTAFTLNEIPLKKIPKPTKSTVTSQQSTPIRTSRPLNRQSVIPTLAALLAEVSPRVQTADSKRQSLLNFVKDSENGSEITNSIPESMNGNNKPTPLRSKFKKKSEQIQPNNNNNNNNNLSDNSPVLSAVPTGIGSGNEQSSRKIVNLDMIFRASQIKDKPIEEQNKQNQFDNTPRFNKSFLSSFPNTSPIPSFNLIGMGMVATEQLINNNNNSNNAPQIQFQQSSANQQIQQAQQQQQQQQQEGQSNLVRRSSRKGWQTANKQQTLKKLRTLLSIHDAKNLLTEKVVAQSNNSNVNSPLRKNPQQLQQNSPDVPRNITITHIGHSLFNSGTPEIRSKSKTLTSAMKVHLESQQQQPSTDSPDKQNTLFQQLQTQQQQQNNFGNLLSRNSQTFLSSSLNKQLKRPIKGIERQSVVSEYALVMPGQQQASSAIPVQYKGVNSFGDTSISLKIPDLNNIEADAGESSPQNNFIPPSRVHFDAIIKNSNVNSDVDSASSHGSEEGSSHHPSSPGNAKRLMNNSSAMMQRSENYYQQLLREGRQLSITQITSILDFIFSFDKPHHFTNYFPKFNMNLVLKRYIKNQEQQIYAHMSTAVRPGTQRILPRKQIYQKRLPPTEKK